VIVPTREYLQKSATQPPATPNTERGKIVPRPVILSLPNPLPPFLIVTPGYSPAVLPGRYSPPTLYSLITPLPFFPSILVEGLVFEVEKGPVLGGVLFD